jgi:hypothetical protein
MLATWPSGEYSFVITINKSVSASAVSCETNEVIIAPYPSDEMRMWEISPGINSPKNDDPSLWEPLHPEPTQTTTDALELLRE